MKRIHIRFLALAIIIACTCLTISSQSPDTSGADLIHYGDLVDVDVIGSFEFDWRGTLDPEGFLEGADRIEKPIFALCRSETEVAAAIAGEYSKMLRDPKVVVKIIDRSNRAVAYIDGAVRNPKRFQIKRPVNLRELLILSGGITDRSSGEISIFRPENVSCSQSESADAFVKASQSTGTNTIKIKISDLLKGSEAADPPIYSGDIITVLEALPVYVIGGVNNPRQLASRSDMTLTHAIDSSGGPFKDSRDAKVTIYRRDGKGQTTLIADLKKIRSGEEKDPALLPFDIVDVPVKGAAERKFPPVIENASGRSNARLKLPLVIVD